MDDEVVVRYHNSSDILLSGLGELGVGICWFGLCPREQSERPALDSWGDKTPGPHVHAWRFERD